MQPVRTPTDTLSLQIPAALLPVWDGPALYRGAYGGRGSGKTRTFAKMAAVQALRFAQAGISGQVVCAREFLKSLDESSLPEIKAAISEEPMLAERFDVGEKYIRTRVAGGRVDFSFIGLRHNLHAVRGMSRILLFWLDEAEPVSAESYEVVDPTIREKDAELWVTWNPASEASATHKRFRLRPSPDARIVECNWRDNPWFPATLDKKRRADLIGNPEQYDHIWEGGFRQVATGAYWAADLLRARQEGRITTLAEDPLLSIRSYHDIGGAGARADAYAIWVVQFVGQTIRVLDYYEAQGQPLATHAAWLRTHWPRAEIYLPHDGAVTNSVTGVVYAQHWRDAGFGSVQVIANQGRSAAMKRVEAARRWFPRIWFDEARTASGRSALGWYHPKVDASRNIDLGPDHDWSSHAADAFGTMCCEYQEPRAPSVMPRRQRSANSWMG